MSLIIRRATAEELIGQLKDQLADARAEVAQRKELVTVAAAAKRAALAFEQQVHAADADIAERMGHHDLAVAKAQALANLQNVAAEAAQQLADKVAGLQVSLDSASDAVRRTMDHG